MKRATVETNRNEEDRMSIRKLGASRRWPLIMVVAMFFSGVGPAFLLQASGALAVALLLLLTATVVPRLIAAGLALGALGGFAASRTIGIFGFIEYGLQPAPQALISVLVEIATLGLLMIATAREGSGKGRLIWSR